MAYTVKSTLGCKGDQYPFVGILTGMVPTAYEKKQQARFFGDVSPFDNGRVLYLPKRRA
jgi:hypothetical protein